MIKNAVLAASLLVCPTLFADGEESQTQCQPQSQSQSQSQSQRQQCQRKSNRLYMLTSSSHLQDNGPMGGLSSWDERYIEMFRKRGYDPIVIERSEHHKVVERGDLILSVFIDREDSGWCKVRAWIHEVVDNPGINENSIVQNLVKEGHSKGFSCSRAMKRAIKELPKYFNGKMHIKP